MTTATDGLEYAFVRLRQSLRNYLRRRLSDAAQVDDLLQDVFVKALTTQQAGRPIRNLTGWLYAATRSALADYYRAQGAPTVALDDEWPVDEVDDLTLHQELSSCMRPFIEQLPAVYRETLVAAELEGKTMRAMAEEQRVSVSAIKSRAARGRAMLKKAMLACCAIEMNDGLVADYHRRPAPACGGKRC